MTRLIKLIMVATIVVASVAQADIFKEDYTGGTEPDQAYVTSNGVTWVDGTGLTVSNSSAVFEYGGGIVTNAQVAFTVVPVLNDAIPTDVDDAAVVFWVNTSSNVSYLTSLNTSVTDTAVNVLTTGTPPATAGAVALIAQLNYVDKTFTLSANGTALFSGGPLPFYNTTPTNLTQLEIRETSATNVAVVEVFVVQEVVDGEPTLASDIGLKVYEKDGTVYVELNVVSDGTSSSFKVYRGTLLIGTITYDGQSVYTIEDSTAVLGETYDYTVKDYGPDGARVGSFDFPIKVLPLLEAKSMQMTQTEMTITFASYAGETYQVLGATSLVAADWIAVTDDESNPIVVEATGDTTSILVPVDGDFRYFKVIN